MRVTLRAVRRRKLLTVRQLSALSGVTAANISRIENGRVQPRFSTIRRLAKALDVEPEELVEFADEDEERDR